MRAFISYSLNDSEQYILTILSRMLKQRGYSITSRYHDYGRVMDYETSSKLDKSNLFIGIVTKSGTKDANKNVLAEWKEARRRKIPALILIEKNVKVTESLRNNPNSLFFDRYNPEIAINKIKSKISPKKPVKKSDNSAAWVLGGLAALAIIGLLSKDD